MESAETAVECKLKSKCPNATDDSFNCWDPECNGWMHQQCSVLLLNRFQIAIADRPDTSEVSDTGKPVVFCKKGCYSKWQSTKKKEAKAAAAAAKASLDAQKTKKPRKVPCCGSLIWYALGGESMNG